MFLVFFKLFKNNKIECPCKGNSGDKITLLNFFGQTHKSQGEADTSKCESLAREVEKCRSILSASKSMMNSKRIVIYSTTQIPGVDTKTNYYDKDVI